MLGARGWQVHVPLVFVPCEKPGESNIPWDYYDLLHTTPAVQTFAPMATEGCKLVKA